LIIVLDARPALTARRVDDIAKMETGRVAGCVNHRYVCAWRSHSRKSAETLELSTCK
jgi:hypothetical protein